MKRTDVNNLLNAYESLNAEPPNAYPLSFAEYTDRGIESWGKKGFETFPIEKKVNLLLRTFGSRRRTISVKI